ncbi:tRNA (adenosine(37)-N6)-threonylcarbamoyltransferase complex ATPase subunit type 1 TsaE [Motiliproteus sp. SC1-56]|uniref:tRNA (adenosine(37)-N6)-threonylcarbamoyltransferase complex ATPase subunit type 1 TsaE n=1 Tax=Motiliproteus sp. SC1-56 TaxID=2799565 RepID=UPI001A8EB352|nr:tRNA (adenosine(37)-N6)-threonylcarbamoyltransferase complex ATPase subunit type 1 TsaE [Motiliproteus sp. SC1-56]
MDVTQQSFLVEGEAAMVAFGQALGRASEGEATIFLIGNLGMGKTTLSRGVLRSFGHAGAVKSPTYTLVEPYELDAGLVYHFDLYRLGDPEELEYLGIRDYFSAPAVRLVEWPERGAAILPTPDLKITIEKAGEGRLINCHAMQARGMAMLEALHRYTEQPAENES